MGGSGTKLRDDRWRFTNNNLCNKSFVFIYIYLSLDGIFLMEGGDFSSREKERGERWRLHGLVQRREGGGRGPKC